MDASRIDIFKIYRRYSDIKSGHAYIAGEEGYRQDSDLHKAKVSREALTQLSKLVESRVSTGCRSAEHYVNLLGLLGICQESTWAYGILEGAGNDLGMISVKTDFISANAIVSKVAQMAAVGIARGVTASCDMMSFCGAAASCVLKLLQCH
ncbi:hypothetical protein V8G54_018675 [Vigna mungo]|uniref:Uncharacterized protein n=1 Tax=Vigna mungo TaxID=3915 RepID=A0AAQ3RUU8_VIGMU